MGVKTSTELWKLDEKSKTSITKKNYKLKPEVKNTIAELKNTLEGIKSRFHDARYKLDDKK